MEVSEKIGTPLNNMPELPEVETIKNTLLPLLKNRKILSIDIKRHQTILGESDVFKNALTNKTFLDITRIGKYLIFHLSEDKVFISHLRMEGKYFIFKENMEDTKHARVVFRLDNDEKLIYDDSRCFGIMKLSDESSYLTLKEISILGKEPSQIEDVSYLYEKTKKSSLPIKQFLLDQSNISGLGNIYVDETLFKAKIHPLTPSNMLTKNECSLIVKHAKETLENAIRDGGSTIKSYHPANNIDGRFQTRLLCYGKAGESCPICKTPFRFVKLGGRGTTFCPKCQEVRKKKISIGITGKIASGKSEVLSYFKTNGYPCISSDDIVSELYKNKTVINKINEMFSLTFVNEVDKNILRDVLLTNKAYINKLNRYIHPLVKKEILKFISSSKSQLIFVEVPLLFEAKFEDIFDYIIAIDVSKEIQSQRLIKRNPLSKEQLEKIYNNDNFNKYKKLADIIIVNDKTIHQLHSDLNKILNKLKARLN